MAQIIIHESTTSILCKLKIGDEARGSAKQAKQLRSLISGYIKNKFPLRVFETTVSDDEFIIKRAADLISE